MGQIPYPYSIKTEELPKKRGGLQGFNLCKSLKNIKNDVDKIFNKVNECTD